MVLAVEDPRKGNCFSFHVVDELSFRHKSSADFRRSCDTRDTSKQARTTTEVQHPVERAYSDPKEGGGTPSPKALHARKPTLTHSSSPPQPPSQ
jgi:hypothetical protein